MFVKKEDIELAISKTDCMGGAAAEMKLHFSTFKRHATKYGLYEPNQGSKGRKKPKAEGRGRTPLKEILDGLHPQYQSYKLKRKLYDAGLKENKCEECGIDEWNDKPLECELDHIDGDRTNHQIDNLKIVCPNCHSQTGTFRYKRGKGA